MVGLSFDADSTIRRLQADSHDIDYLEIDATGFFARPSPYLAWLKTRFRLVVRAGALSIGTPGPLSAPRLQSFADVARASNCGYVVHPLGFSEADAIELGTPVHFSLNETSLGVVAEHVSKAADQCVGTPLIEPITAPLGVPGAIGETEFLNRLCRRAGCRLLIDVGTLLVASRNFRFDPHSWLDDIDGELIAVARITGCAVRNDRWRTDARQRPDEAAWELLRYLASRAHPELVILGSQHTHSHIDRLRSDLQRLRDTRKEAHVSGRSKRPIETSQTTTQEPDTLGCPPLVETQAVDNNAQVVSIAPDASLFVLDDSGVFFSETRRELSLFNSAATLVWCLMEQRLTVQEITATYQQTFGVETSEAADHVTAILQQWFGLGYIDNPNLSSGPEVPLTTAIAQVLTNAQLRKQFKESPWELAKALGLKQDEVEVFTQLDPGELEAQAEDVAEWHAARRQELSRTVRWRDTPNDTIEAAEARLDVSGVRQVRRYRLLGTTFDVRMDSDVLDVQAHEALAHLECSESVSDELFDVRVSPDGGWDILNGGALAQHCHGSEEVIPALKRLLREVSVNRAEPLIRVHAAVVSFGSGCVLMPASAGSGKTTLTAALIQSGGTYFSDEVALLERGSLAVRPVPLALTVKDGGVAPLRHSYPEIDALTVHLREDYQRVRYLPPPPASLPADGGVQGIKWIVFPRYDVDTQTSLRPLARPIALQRLLIESVVDVDRLDRATVESLVQDMRIVECFDLPFSSLETAVELVRSLISTPEH